MTDSKAPFGLGICGWGWITQNFPALDRALPKDVVFSAISMSVGNAPVSPNFGRLEGRQKWAIPWFEDDGALSSPQLWAGRMRRVNTFRYARAMAHAGCARGALDGLMEQIGKQSDPEEQRRLARDQALPLREQMVQLFGDMYGYLLATLNNSSELGAVVNIEQQSLLRTQFLIAHDPRLEQLLGEPLPATTQPWKNYRGPARVLVLTARGSATQGEELVPPIIALDQHPMKSVVVKMRPLGRGEWRTVAAQHRARAVYRAKLPAATEDFEYSVEAVTADGQTLRWPATTPALNQTVVLTEWDKSRL